MELRIAWDEGEGVLTAGGGPIGEPGDDGVVLLARLKLDATVGSDNFEVTDSGDMLCEIGGRSYIVAPALVKRSKDGKFDDSFLFIGTATTAAPQTAQEEPPEE